MLNAARGMPQDWQDDRDEWQVSLVIKSSGESIQTFSKIQKIYEEKRSKADAAKDEFGKAFFYKITVMRQKMIGVEYTAYFKAPEDRLIEGHQALLSPHWPLYLGESDDLVDILSPRIVEVEPITANRIHSIIPGLIQGCRLVKVPNRFTKQIVRKKENWHVEPQLYSIPPSGGIELSKPKLAYSIEGRNIVFNGNSW